ncbi:PDZ and LIM domain protein Zasp-like isoform X40 [Artemia franciscana]|uniref:PDZ and LIM domain protein Zasp-like isoform X40 n=1 Tax=Artemia franciscana TaxID=6661 RepID=UPI0032DA357A
MAQVPIKLSKFDNQPWGFRIQGGKDFSVPITVQKVNGGSLAERAGLNAGDTIVAINGIDALKLRHKEAQDAIVRAGNNFEMVVVRGNIWKPVVTPLAEPKIQQNGEPTILTKTSLAANQQPKRHILGNFYNSTPKPYLGRRTSQDKENHLRSLFTQTEIKNNTNDSAWQKRIDASEINEDRCNSVSSTSSENNDAPRHVGSAHNLQPAPFGKKVPITNGHAAQTALPLAKQYNSPAGLYSEESIAETLTAQAEVLAQGVLGVNFKKNERQYDPAQSEVLKMIQEADSAPRAHETGISCEPVESPRKGSQTPLIQSHAFRRLQNALLTEQKVHHFMEPKPGAFQPRVTAGALAVKPPSRSAPIQAGPQCDNCEKILVPSNDLPRQQLEKLRPRAQATAQLQAAAAGAPIPDSVPAQAPAPEPIPVSRQVASPIPPVIKAPTFSPIPPIKQERPFSGDYAAFAPRPVGTRFVWPPAKNPENDPIATATPLYFPPGTRPESFVETADSHSMETALQKTSFESFSSSSLISKTVVEMSSQVAQSTSFMSSNQTLPSIKPVQAPVVLEPKPAPSVENTNPLARPTHVAFAPSLAPKPVAAFVPATTTPVIPATLPKPVVAPAAVFSSASNASVVPAPSFTAPYMPGPAPAAPVVGASGQTTSAPRRGKGVLSQKVGPGVRIPVCSACEKQIRGPFVTALGRNWCPEHFVCANESCKRHLQDTGFVEEKNELYCESCFENYLAPICDKCQKRVVGDCLKAIGKQFHPECFACAYCGRLFGNSRFYLEDGLPYCEADWNELFTTKCFGCGFPIEAGDRWVEAMNNNYHSQCFNCSVCASNLEGIPFYAKAGKAICKSHAVKAP